MKTSDRRSVCIVAAALCCGALAVASGCGKDSKLAQQRSEFLKATQGSKPAPRRSPAPSNSPQAKTEQQYPRTEPIEGTSAQPKPND